VASYGWVALGNPPPGSAPAKQPAVNASPNGSYLFTIRSVKGKNVELLREVYAPSPGDLFLFDDHSVAITALYRLVGTSGPLHSAIALRRPDGTMGLLEAGPNFHLKVFVFPAMQRLHTFSGTILVRRLKTPLSADQSARLTKFSMAQEGKPYSMVRLLAQATPIKPRGDLRKLVLGRTCLDRDSWTCSELTAAAATAAGILDPKVHFANAMYPRDFAYDDVFDLKPYYHEPALWYPRPNLTTTADNHGIQVSFPGNQGKPLPR